MFQKITRRNLDKFLEGYATNKKILDIGSGGSSYGRYFPNRLTVDIDPDRNPEIVADAHALPFRDGEFEVVLCTEVLEHVKDPIQVISELRRVLKIGGKVILTTRFVYPLHDTPNDFWRFTEYGLKLLFKDWRIIDFRSETATFSTIAVLLQRIGFQTKLHMNKISKLLIFGLAYIFDKINFLVVKEFGDIQKSQVVENILSSGYYVVAEKIN